MIRNIIFICLLGVTIVGRGQTIGGMVAEMQNGQHQPIPGVNVLWLGTQRATTTDANGRFSIQKQAGDRKLVFSFIGYTPDTVTVDTETNLHVMLQAGVNIKEVNVVQQAAGGYGHLESMQVQKITGAELQKAACCNLSESFETNASVDVNYSDALTGAKQIELLGLAGKYSQILTEKVPAIHGLATTYGLGYIPGPWMESIQVSKGAASVIDGFESVTGQINIEEKKPQHGERLLFNAYGNQDGRVEANLNARTKVSERWKAALLLHGDNETQRLDHNNDGFVDMPTGHQYSAMSRWTYGDHHSGGIESQTAVKVLTEKRLGGQKDFTSEDLFADSSRYGMLVKTNRVEAFNKTGYIFKRPATSVGWINAVSYHDQRSHIGGTQYNGTEQSWYSNLIFQSYIGNTNHTMYTGSSLWYDHYNETLQNNAVQRTDVIPGVFAQYSSNLTEKLTVLGGIRADHSNRFGWFYTPRAHVKYRPLEHTTFRASVGKGYRIPNVWAENSYLFASSRQLVVTEDIKMEEAWNYGITATQSFDFGQKRGMTIYAEYFRTDFLNQMITDLDVNASEARISNLHGKSFSNNYQVEVSLKPVRGLEVVTALRMSDVRATYNDTLRERPLTNTYKGLLQLSYQTPMRKWQFDFTSQFNGGGRLPSTYGMSERRFAPYTIFNAQITKYFLKWNVYLGVENIGNFVQHTPIISADKPYSASFDGSTIWGPVKGRMVYGGFRIILGEFDEE